MAPTCKQHGTIWATISLLLLTYPKARTHGHILNSVEMNSLAPYSVGTCLTSLQPQKRNHSNSLTTTCSIQVPQPPPVQLNRRDAIGLSLSFGLVHSLLQPIIPIATAASEVAPCELTVAPSGLSFCDKIVGTGPQAVKGQLIKVRVTILLVICCHYCLFPLSYV